MGDVARGGADRDQGKIYHGKTRGQNIHQLGPPYPPIFAAFVNVPTSTCAGEIALSQEAHKWVTEWCSCLTALGRVARFLEVDDSRDEPNS